MQGKIDVYLALEREVMDSRYDRFISLSNKLFNIVVRLAMYTKLLVCCRCVCNRMGDRSKEARAEHRKKSKEERDIARDEMKVRRHEEKEKMHEARQMRKDIDSLIREKMMNSNFAGPELR